MQACLFNFLLQAFLGCFKICFKEIIIYIYIFYLLFDNKAFKIMSKNGALSSYNAILCGMFSQFKDYKLFMF